jgi:hypothetical protein
MKEKLGTKLENQALRAVEALEIERPDIEEVADRSWFIYDRIRHGEIQRSTW